jgi:hypothetical protein
VLLSTEALITDVPKSDEDDEGHDHHHGDFGDDY